MSVFSKCEVTSPLKIGLSVSHDSIFSPENNANVANNESLDVPHCSSLSVRHTSMKNMFKVNKYLSFFNVLNNFINDVVFICEHAILLFICVIYYFYY